MPIKVLINNNIDLNITCGDNLNLIHMACYANNYNAVKFLIKHGVNCNLLTNTACDYIPKNHNDHTYCHIGLPMRIDRVGYNIVPSFHEITYAKNNKFTGLNYAINHNNIEMLNLLLSNMDIRDNCYAQTLIYAIDKGNIDIIKSLINNSININHRAYCGINMKYVLLHSDCGGNSKKKSLKYYMIMEWNVIHIAKMKIHFCNML
jgi:ankyrin repeat protein